MATEKQIKELKRFQMQLTRLRQQLRALDLRKKSDQIMAVEIQREINSLLG